MAGFEWQLLDTDDNVCTWIAKVPTGWLLKENVYKNAESESSISSNIIHIKDIFHAMEEKWEALIHYGCFIEYDSAIEKMKNLKQDLKLTENK